MIADGIIPARSNMLMTLSPAVNRIRRMMSQGRPDDLDELEEASSMDMVVKLLLMVLSG